MRKPRLYFSSKVRHAAKWRAYENDERFKLHCSWIYAGEKGDIQDWPDHWVTCVNESKEADATIFYHEDGEKVAGALIEVGAALGNDHPLYYVGDISLGSYLQHPHVRFCKNVDKAIEEAVGEYEQRLYDECRVLHAWMKMVGNDVPFEEVVANYDKYVDNCRPMEIKVEWGK